MNVGQCWPSCCSRGPWPGPPTARFRASRVMATANTPSLNASSLPRSMALPTLARSHRSDEADDDGTNCSPLSAVHCQDDAPGLLLRFDVPGRLDHVLDWVAPVDDRPVPPRL